jgi:hypothetical protein
VLGFTSRLGKFLRKEDIMTQQEFIQKYMNAVRQYMAVQAQLALEFRWIWDALGLGASITDDDLVEYGITATDLNNAVNTVAAVQALLTENGNAHSGNLYRVAGRGGTTAA